MKWYTTMLIPGFLVAATVQAQAGGIFVSRKPAPNPDQHIYKLVNLAQSCRNSSQRAHAVQQLRNFDAVKYPQVVPVLVNVLRTDKSINVRIEAARSLGRVRPLTPAAREALAEASMHDSAFRVRWQARTSLTVYTVARINPRNYAPTNSKASRMTTKEPPVGGPFVSPESGTVPVREKTKDPVFMTPPPRSVGYARPLPKGPDQPPQAAPNNSAPQGTLVPHPAPSGEPPLAPNILPLQPANPPANPQPQPTNPDEPLPLIPPVPPASNNDGPILVPPGG